MPLLVTALRPLAKPLATFWMLTLVCGLLWGGPALTGRGQAHEVTPAIIDLSFEKGVSFTLAMTLNLESLVAQLGEGHSDTSQAANADVYNRLRALPPGELRKEFDAFTPTLLAGMVVEIDGKPVPTFVKRLAIPEVGDLDLPRESLLEISGALPRGANGLTWRWSPTFGAAILRERKADGKLGYSDYLSGGAGSAEIVLPKKNWWELF